MATAEEIKVLQSIGFSVLDDGEGKFRWINDEGTAQELGTACAEDEAWNEALEIACHDGSYYGAHTVKQLRAMTRDNPAYFEGMNASRMTKQELIDAWAESNS